MNILDRIKPVFGIEPVGSTVHVVTPTVNSVRSQFTTMIEELDVVISHHTAERESKEEEIKRLEGCIMNHLEEVDESISFKRNLQELIAPKKR